MTARAGPFGDGALGGASDRLARCLGRLGEPVRLPAGAVLFEQGDPGDAIYAVETGLLEVSVLSADGRRLTLNTLGPGEVFGEIALFDAGPRTSGIAARSDATLIRVGRTRVLAEIAADPDLAADLLALAGQRLRWISEALEEVTFLGLSPRLARRVLHLHRRFGGADDTLPYSQAELAEQVGVTREAVARVIGGWRRRGWVEAGRGRLQLRDLAALEAESEADGA